MSSFYGGGAILKIINGSGVGGSSDYDDLQNKPINNLVGSVSFPVVLPFLEEGIYIVKGQVQLTPDGQVDEVVTPIQVIVGEDGKSGEKIVFFTFIEDGEVKTQLITRKENNQYEVKTMILSSDSTQQETKHYWIEI